MKDYIILTNCIVPVGDNSLVHHFHILEWPITEMDDVPVVKVGVGCKEHPAAIIFMIYLFSILCASLHVNNIVVNTHQTEMTERSLQKQLSQTGIKQNSWKAW